MSSCIFLSNIISHFLLDLYSLTGYIHNQLAIDFPPAIVHPKISSLNTAVPVLSEGGVIICIAEAKEQSTPFEVMESGHTTVFRKKAIHLTSYYQTRRGS